MSPKGDVFAKSQRLNDEWERTGKVNEKLLREVQSEIPEGYEMAEDFTLVPSNFYSRTSWAEEDPNSPNPAPVRPAEGQAQGAEITKPGGGFIPVPQSLLDFLPANTAHVIQPVELPHLVLQLLNQIQAMNGSS